MVKSNETIKSSKIEILIAGIGGEGVTVAAELLGEAATIDGKFASIRSTYGASQRGEAVFSEVIISDLPIQFNFVEFPKYFIAFSQQGFESCFDKIVSDVKPVLFIESTFNFNLHGFEKQYTVKKLQARECALENGLSMNNSNIIMLGSFINLTNIISKQAIEHGLKSKFSKFLLKENIKALKLGYSLSSN